MRPPRFVALVVACVLLLPVAASAAATPSEPGSFAKSEVTIDFARGSTLGNLHDDIVKIAWEAVPLMLVIALFFEAFGKAPGEARNFGSVALRLAAVSFLLLKFHTAFGSILYLTQKIATQVRPAGITLLSYNQQADQLRAALAKATGAPPPQQAGGNSVLGPGILEVIAQPTHIYDALINFAILVASAVIFVIERVGAVLTGLLYLLGPLALVAGIPRFSSTISNWLKQFITLASWPIFAGLLLRLIISTGVQANTVNSGGGYLSALVTCGVMAACSLSVPAIAAGIVGAAVTNAVALGGAAALSVASQANHMASGGIPLASLLKNRGSSGGASGASASRGRGGGSGGVATNAPNSRT